MGAQVTTHLQSFVVDRDTQGGWFGVEGDDEVLTVDKPVT